VHVKLAIEQVVQGNRRLYFARAVHSRPSRPIGDAAYRQHAGGGPNQGHICACCL